jgi:hypothetical protein
MERFLKRREGRIKGIIAGFDRILFKGSLRSISSRRMMQIYLFSQHILYKDFGKWAEKLSDRIKEHAKAVLCSFRLRPHGRVVSSWYLFSQSIAELGQY